MMKPLGLLLLLLFSLSTWAGKDSLLTPSRYLTISGLQIAAYESAGMKGPGFLLIHGNTSSSNTFAKILNSKFARKHRMVAIDLPGYGQSENAPSYDIALFNTVITEAAVALGVDDGIIVGWSLGGDFALQASDSLPNAKGYFLFGTAPVGGGPVTIAPFLSPAESYAGAATAYGFIPVLTSVQIDQYVQAFFRPNWVNVPAQFFLDGYRTDSGTRLAVAMAAGGLDPNFKAEVPVVQNLQVPIAIVHAQKDAFVRLEYLEAIAPSIPQLWRNEIVVVPMVGHIIQWEKPKTFIKLLRSFMHDLQ